MIEDRVLDPSGLGRAHRVMEGTMVSLDASERLYQSSILCRWSEIYILKTYGSRLEIRDTCQSSAGIASFDMKSLLERTENDYDQEINILDVKFVGREDEGLIIAAIVLVREGQLHHLYSCCLRLSDDVQPWVFKSKISYVDKPTFGIISDRCKSLLHTLVVSSDMHVHIYVVKVNPMERFTLIDPLVLTPPEKAVVCAAYECSDEKGTRTLLALVTTSGSILIYNVSIIESKYSILNAVILQEITGVRNAQIRRVYISPGPLSAEVPGFVTAVYAKTSSIVSNTWVVHSKTYNKNYMLVSSISVDDEGRFVDIRIWNDFSSYVIQYITKDANEFNLVVNTLVMDHSGDIMRQLRSTIQHNEIDDFMPLPLGTGIMILSDLNTSRLVWPTSESEKKMVEATNTTSNIYKLRRRIKYNCLKLRNCDRSLLVFDHICKESKAPQFIQLYPPSDFDDMRHLLSQLNRNCVINPKDRSILLSYVNHTFRYGCRIPEDEAKIRTYAFEEVNAYIYWLLDVGKYRQLLDFISNMPYDINTLIEDITKKLIERNMYEYALRASQIHRNQKEMFETIPECMFMRTNYDIPLTFLLMKTSGASDKLMEYFFERTINLCIESQNVDTRMLSRFILLTFSNEHEALIERACINSDVPQAHVFPILYYLLRGRYNKIPKFCEKLRHKEPFSSCTAGGEFLATFVNPLHSERDVHSDNAYFPSSELISTHADAITITVRNAIDYWCSFKNQGQRSKFSNKPTNNPEFMFESSDGEEERVSPPHAPSAEPSDIELLPQHEDTAPCYLEMEKDPGGREPKFDDDTIDPIIGPTFEDDIDKSRIDDYAERRDPTLRRSGSYLLSLVSRLRHYLLGKSGAKGSISTQEATASSKLSEGIDPSYVDISDIDTRSKSPNYENGDTTEKKAAETKCENREEIANEDTGHYESKATGLDDTVTDSSALEPAKSEVEESNTHGSGETFSSIFKANLNGALRRMSYMRLRSTSLCAPQPKDTPHAYEEAHDYPAKLAPTDSPRVSDTSHCISNSSNIEEEFLGVNSDHERKVRDETCEDVDNANTQEGPEKGEEAVPLTQTKVESEETAIRSRKWSRRKGTRRSNRSNTVSSSNIPSGRKRQRRRI